MTLAFTCSIRSICPNSGSSTAACVSTTFRAIKSAARITVPTPAAHAPNERLNTAKVEADLFSWNAGIVYKPDPDIGSIYAAYGTSESPIGSELDSTGAQYNGLSSILVNAPPQEARAVEVGTKWELFDRRLLATAALFQTDVENARTNAAPANPNVNDPNPPIDPLLFHSGEYRVRGIELSAAGNITKDVERVRRARAPRHGGPEVRPCQPARCRTTAGQHSADAVLAAVKVSADRPIGASAARRPTAARSTPAISPPTPATTIRSTGGGSTPLPSTS